jgi:hypothetical protein
MNAAAPFLPRSDSKIVLALVLGAYSIVLDRLLFLIVLVFRTVRQPPTMLSHYGRWAEALDSVVLFPIVAGTVLVATIELLRLLRLPRVLQIVLAAAASCAINGRSSWPMGIILAPLFLLSGYAYLLWRPHSWSVALAYTILIMVVSGLPAGISVFEHATRSA